MKKLLTLWLVFSSLLSFAQDQVRLQLVNTTVSGVPITKVVPRNLSIYPFTTAGNTGFLTDLNGGLLPLRAVPSEGAIVGRYSYNFSDSRKDFLNHSVVSDPAPVLVDGVRTAPRLVGNYYQFKPQTALNTALYKRIPAFTAHSSKIIIYPGGLYTDTTDNALMSRGWTHTAESAKWIDGAPYPTQYRRALEMPNYQAAYNAAQSLDNSDPRKAKLLAWAGPLPAFEGDHLFIDDEETCKLYAQYWWNTFKQDDWKGAGVDFFSVNHEVWKARTSNYAQEWYNQVGWITKEIIRLAALEGKTLKSGMSDWANLTNVNPQNFEENDSQTGYPRYMSFGTIGEPFRGSSQSAPLGNSTDLGQLMKDGKAFVGTGSYIQHTWDDQSLFVKNPNGTYKIGSDGGLIWRTDKRTTTIGGQQTVLYGEDAYKSQLKFYGRFARFCTNLYFRAGGIHLPGSTVRQPGFESVRLLSQFRLDTEVESGLSPSSTGTTDAEFATLNHRPLNPDWTEMDGIAMYLFTDYLRGWSESQPKTSLGADNGTLSKARQSVEMYTKAFHRASQLNWIFSTTWQLIQPKLWIKGTGVFGPPDLTEAFYRKPIIWGGLATKDGHPTIFLNWVWPCQDTDRYTDVTVWVDKGSGVVSPGYRIRLKGRKTGLEYWTLPDAVAGAEPKHVYFQFNSLLGEKITWRGDYREARITAHPTPPAIQEAELNNLTAPTSTTTTTPGSGTVAAPSWIAGLRYSYVSPLLTFEAAGDIGAMKFERLDGTPFTLINPDGVSVSSGNYYSWGQLFEQTPFDRQWKLNWSSGAALRITAQQTSSTSTFSYTVTPSPNANRIVLSGSNTSPPATYSGLAETLAGDFPYQPLATTSIPSDYTVVQESDTVKLVMNLKTGSYANNGLAGGIQGIWDKTIGRNQISNPRYIPGRKDEEGRQPGTLDLGSGFQPAFYRLPAPWSLNGFSMQIGDNPLQIGDINAQSSALLAYGRGLVFGKTIDFSRVDMAQWNGPNTGNSLKLGDILSQWVNQNGNRTHVWYHLKLNRNSSNGGDNFQLYPRYHELPAGHANGSLGTWHWYDGDAPYTGAPSRSIVLPENSGQTQGSHYVTENWVACIGSDGRGIGIICPTPSIKIGQYDGLFNLANGEGFGRSYLSWQPQLLLDNNIDLKFSLVYVTGTLPEIRKAAYDLTKAKRALTPEYRFNQPGRQLWSLKNANDGGHQTTRTNWDITWQAGGQLYSPAGAWDAVSHKHVYLRYRYVTYNRAHPGMSLKWRRARQADFSMGDNPTAIYNAIYTDGHNAKVGYDVSISLDADGEWHTAHWDLSGQTEWKGIINELQFITDGAMANGERIQIEWLSGSISGPTP